jgi:hypothetical protein
VTQSWFTQQSERQSRARALVYLHAFILDRDERTITASVPIYFDHYWYGVVAMDFTLDTMQRLLTDATEDRTEGEYQLYDTRLNMIATSAHAGSPVNQFDERETAQIAQAIEMIPAAVSASGAVYHLGAARSF